MRANKGYPATPSYEEMGKTKPKRKGDDRPFMNHKPAPVKYLVINENQVGREERRRQERMILKKQRYEKSLGEKHRKRLKLS